MAHQILVAEDSVTMQRVIELTLSKEDVQLSKAATGRDALARSKQTPPALALIDLGLPDMDGYALAKALKGELGASLKVILMAAKQRPYDAERGQDAGADGHIVKPFETQAFVNELRLHLGLPKLEEGPPSLLAKARAAAAERAAQASAAKAGVATPAAQLATTPAAKPSPVFTAPAFTVPINAPPATPQDAAATSTQVATPAFNTPGALPSFAVPTSAPTAAPAFAASTSAPAYVPSFTIPASTTAAQPSFTSTPAVLPSFTVPTSTPAVLPSFTVPTSTPAVLPSFTAASTPTPSFTIPATIPPGWRPGEGTATTPRQAAAPVSPQAQPRPAPTTTTTNPIDELQALFETPRSAPINMPPPFGAQKTPASPAPKSVSFASPQTQPIPAAARPTTETPGFGGLTRGLPGMPVKEAPPPFTPASASPTAQPTWIPSAPQRDPLAFTVPSAVSTGTAATTFAPPPPTRIEAPATTPGLNLQGLSLPPDALQELIRQEVERIVWDIVPELAESMIRKRLDELVAKESR